MSTDLHPQNCTQNWKQITFKALCQTKLSTAQRCPVVPSGAQRCPAVPSGAKQWMSEVPFKTCNGKSEVPFKKCLKVTKSLFKNEEKKIKTNWKKVRSNGKIGILRPAINVWRPNYKKGLPFLRFKLTTFHSRLANLSIQLLNFLYKWCL